MRSFVVSCILLTVVTVFLVVNMITIHQYSKELYTLCEELPDSAEACKADSELQSRVEKLNEAWQKYRFYINFSVGYAYTEKIEDLKIIIGKDAVNLLEATYKEFIKYGN